jgi:hypothetical protein
MNRDEVRSFESGFYEVDQVGFAGVDDLIFDWSVNLVAGAYESGIRLKMIKTEQ